MNDWKTGRALESQSNWAQAAEVQRRRLALDPDSVWITYRLSRDLVSAGEQAQADTLMRNMVSRRPGMPSGFMPGSLFIRQ